MTLAVSISRFDIFIARGTQISRFQNGILTSQSDHSGNHVIFRSQHRCLLVFVQQGGLVFSGHFSPVDQWTENHSLLDWTTLTVRAPLSHSSMRFIDSLVTDELSAVSSMLHTPRRGVLQQMSHDHLLCFILVVGCASQRSSSQVSSKLVHVIVLTLKTS